MQRLPAVLGRLHATRKTPWAAHLTMMVLNAALAGFVPVETLSHLTSVGTLPLLPYLVWGCDRK